MLITNITTFVILRLLMGIVAGLMAGAGAALIRDMSPRLSRALAFGLLTIGPVGANFLANYIAGATLPIYHTWQSQIWIMGFFAIAMYIPIVLWLCDLSPELRMKIYEDRDRSASPPKDGLPSRLRTSLQRARGLRGACWSHLEVWLLVIGSSPSNLTLYFAIQVFGPLMFTEAFHYTPAEAASDESNTSGWRQRGRAGADGTGVRWPADAQADRDFRRAYSPRS